MMKRMVIILYRVRFSLRQRLRKEAVLRMMIRRAKMPAKIVSGIKLDSFGFEGLFF